MEMGLVDGNMLGFGRSVWVQLGWREKYCWIVEGREKERQNIKSYTI